MLSPPFLTTSPSLRIVVFKLALSKNENYDAITVRWLQETSEVKSGAVCCPRFTPTYDEDIK